MDTKNKKSWKTTTLGIAAGVSLIANEIIAVLDQDPATVLSFENVLAGLAAFGIGLFARDNDVSSEDTGAK